MSINKIGDLKSIMSCSYKINIKKLLPCIASVCCWFGVIFNNYLGSIAALCFLLSGMVFIFIYVKALPRVIISYWPILILPFLSFLSTFWSDYSVITLRASIQLLLTTLISIYLADKINPFFLVKSAVIVLLIAMIFSLIFASHAINGLTGEVDLIGIYASKNYLSMHASLAFFLSFSYFLMSFKLIDKILGLSGLVLFSIVIWKANSKGSTFLCLFSFFLATSMAFYQKINFNLVLKTSLKNIFLLTLFIFLTFSFYQFKSGALDELFFSLGKDPTLTGRTILWEIGYNKFKESPILGFGYQSLFVEGNPMAESIWEMFHIPPGSGFNFHNMFIDILLQLGILGFLWFLLLIFLYIKMLFNVKNKYLKAERYLSLLIFIYMFFQAFIESVWNSMFTIMQVMLCVSWVYLKNENKNHLISLKN